MRVPGPSERMQLQELDGVVARQREFFRSGKTRSEGFRREALERLRQEWRAREGEILEALRRDLGKPEQEAYVSELGMLESEIGHALRHLRAWMKPRRGKVPVVAWPSKAVVKREPAGVVLILGPWNYPLQLLLAPLVGALAAGNCAVLKPSEWAPATSRVVAQLIEAAFDPGHVCVVEGGAEVSVELLERRWDHVFFTGSTAVGRKVMLAAAKHLTPVTLELGGKCPVIVGKIESDAALETAARRIVWGKFLNAGQTCVAPDHVWVERSLRDRLVEKLVRATQEFYGAACARLVHRGHFERMREMSGQGRVVCGGKGDEERLQWEPTILVEVSPNAAVMEEEIFGPVLPVLAYDGEEEVRAWLEGKGAPLAMYVFSEDRCWVEQWAQCGQSGAVSWNEVVLHLSGPDLPFGGVGESGMGRYHGKAGFETMTRERVYFRRGLVWDPSFRYPPPRISLERLKSVLRLLS